MADANALAAAIEAEMAAHSAGSGAGEPHIIINDDRSITVPEELLALGVQYDNNVETVTIDCPRYWDGHDLSRMMLFVNFVHYEPNASVKYNVDISELTLAGVDGERMLLDWTINSSAMRYDGTLAWLVCAKTIDADGNELLHWNSQICYDTKVHKGLEYNDDSAAPDIDYISEVLAHILAAQQVVRQDTAIASESAKIAKEAKDKIEALEQIVADVDATAAEQQAQVAAAVKACEDAASNVQLVTGPFYIVDMDQNKTYHAAIQVRSGKPVLVYDELSGTNS